VYSFIPRPKVPVNALYLENMLMCFLGPLEDEGPQKEGKIKQENGENVEIACLGPILALDLA
jgi:hypothetical protein